MTTNKIRTKDRDAIIQSLRAGVVPKTGIQHIQVGRAMEVMAMCQDVETIIDGGASFRLIIGEYGSGKTFFLSVIRSIALEKQLVTITADLSPDRRLHASGGQARNLYAELMRNLATRSKPEGGAIAHVVERFITSAMQYAEKHGETEAAVIRNRLADISNLVGGYDFAKVIEAYWQGHQAQDDRAKACAIRWLRAEYATKTDANRDLGVRTIISDASFYDSLKILSLFIRQAGYAGLLVNLDELVNLYKLRNTQARVSNYEQILRILNDCLQGTASHIGFLLGGTPEFLLDPNRGLYSYNALASRLAKNTFAEKVGVIDYTSPVLHLANLTPEELCVLLGNLRHVFAQGDPDRYAVPDEALEAFLKHCAGKIGDAYFRTPRNTIKAFVNMLAVLDQNPDIQWTHLIESTSIEEERKTDMPDAPDSESSDDNRLTSFSI